MEVIKGLTADRVWRKAIGKLQGVTAVQESRDQATRELLHMSFEIKNPEQRIVFARPINPAFAVAEVIWIMSGGNESAFLRFWNPRMKKFLDEGNEDFYGAYGYRLGLNPKIGNEARRYLTRVRPRNDQVTKARYALEETPHSRQIVLQIWDRFDMPNPTPRSKDIPCNLMSHLLIRDNKLEWLQVMRSNDLIWGTPYNFIQFTCMQEIIAGWLGVGVGTYNHISDSLHVYERHWEEMGQIDTGPVKVPKNQADLKIWPYEEWERMWARLVDGAIALTQVKGATQLLNIDCDLSDLPEGYRQWSALLTAEALRRRGFREEAQVKVGDAGEFWATSWRQWAASTNKEKSKKNG